jgi:hypothetical protein
MQRRWDGEGVVVNQRWVFSVGCEVEAHVMALFTLPTAPWTTVGTLLPAAAAVPDVNGNRPWWCRLTYMCH